MTVSVVIPVHNGEQYIAAAVESVLAQSYSDREIVVVDDGSTDGTQDVLSGFEGQIRVITQSQGGPARARNAGIEASTGEYVAFLDADDVWLPEKLERQMSLAGATPREVRGALILTGYLIVDEDLRPRYLIPGRTRRDVLRSGILDAWGPALSSTAVIPRPCLEQVGGFSEEVWANEDKELALRLATRFEVAVVREPLALYRTHPDQRTHDVDAWEVDTRRLFARLFDGAGEYAIPESWRDRAYANFHMRLAFQALARRAWPTAFDELVEAVRRQPSQAVLAPLEAGARRITTALLARGRRWSFDMTESRQ